MQRIRKIKIFLIVIWSMIQTATRFFLPKPIWTDLTPSLGLSYSVDPNISFYTLHDQSYLPPTGTAVDGSSLKPLKGINYAYTQTTCCRSDLSTLRQGKGRQNYKSIVMSDRMTTYEIKNVLSMPTRKMLLGLLYSWMGRNKYHFFFNK